MRDNNRKTQYYENRERENYRDSRDNSDNASLLKKEQDHRHKIQNRYLATYRLGQLFGLIYNLGVLYLIFNLINNGEKVLALQIFALNAALIAFIILTILVEKRLFSRGGSDRRNRRGGTNRRNDRSGDRNDRREKRQ